jgi:hypothetical protein
MESGGMFPIPMKEAQYALLPVHFKGVVNMSGEKIEVPGGQAQSLLKGCLALPLRNSTLRVLADSHGFDGDVVLPSSPVRLFNLATVLATIPEARFVMKDVSSYLVLWSCCLLLFLFFYSCEVSLSFVDNKTRSPACHLNRDAVSRTSITNFCRRSWYHWRKCCFTVTTSFY